MLALIGGEDGRLAANSLPSAQVWLATIIGPAAAGLLLVRIAPAGLLGFDAATFALLGAQAWRSRTDAPTAEQPVEARAAESGFRLLRRSGLVGLIVLTWLFFFSLRPGRGRPSGLRRSRPAPHAGLPGAYWTSFGVGAFASTLLAGTLRGRATRSDTLLIVAGWGACLIPFSFAPAPANVVCFALGGVVYGPVPSPSRTLACRRGRTRRGDLFKRP